MRSLPSGVGTVSVPARGDGILAVEFAHQDVHPVAGAGADR